MDSLYTEQHAQPMRVDPELVELLQTMITLVEKTPATPRTSNSTPAHWQTLNPNRPEETVMDVCHAGARYTLTRTPLTTCPKFALSPREQEIVQLVAHGQSDREIGVRLGISHWTVGTHLRRIYAKLGVNSRAEMVASVFAKN
ncbi:MAG: helix-turn-helix transcriptional regulator [Caldilineaceae bacterium]